MLVVADDAAHIIVGPGQLLMALELLAIDRGEGPLPEYLQSVEKLGNGDYKIVATNEDPGGD